MKWAFMTANYAAKEVGYKGISDWTQHWGLCEEATIRTFHSPQFAYYFERMLDEISSHHFRAIELWVGHLHPHYASKEMVQTARQLLDKYEVDVVGYTASFNRPNTTAAEIHQVFEVAKDLRANLLTNRFDHTNGARIQAAADTYSISYAFENHPEKNAEEIYNQVVQYSPQIGVTLDTGWLATQNYAAEQAVQLLQHSILHVHLKDVLSADAHESCELGHGIVNIEAVLQRLFEMGYEGAITLEHEPYDRDPMPEVTRSLSYAQQIWNSFSTL